jgi:hypothetical protein
MAAGLPAEVAERLRALVRDRLLQRFGGVELKAASAIGVESGTLNRLLSRRSTGSLGLAERVCSYLSLPISVVTTGTEPDIPALRQLPDWTDALEGAKARILAEMRDIPPDVLELAGDVRATPVPKVTPGLLIELAISLRNSSVNARDQRSRRKATNPVAKPPR